MTGRTTSVLVGLLLAGTVGYVAIGDEKPDLSSGRIRGYPWRTMIGLCLAAERGIPGALAACTDRNASAICHGDTNIGRIVCDDGKTYPLVQDNSHGYVYPKSEIQWIGDPRIASTDRAEVCGYVDGLSYSRRHRALLTEEDRREDFARAGVPWSQHAKMEDDHEIPLDLGGADVPANRHPQPWPEARKKDRLEIHAGREVCAGRLPLATAQGWFLGNWKDAYRQQFGEEP